MKGETWDVEDLVSHQYLLFRVHGLSSELCIVTNSEKQEDKPEGCHDDFVFSNISMGPVSSHSIVSS